MMRQRVLHPKTNPALSQRTARTVPNNGAMIDLA
jgi:hypothetical protein